MSMPMGSLVVHHDVETTGGEGTSLVKGVQMTLKAIAFSVKPGGTIKELTVGGTVEALGKGSTATAIDGQAPTP